MFSLVRNARPNDTDQTDRRKRIPLQRAGLRGIRAEALFHSDYKPVDSARKLSNPVEPVRIEATPFSYDFPFILG